MSPVGCSMTAEPAQPAFLKLGVSCPQPSQQSVCFSNILRARPRKAILVVPKLPSDLSVSIPPLPPEKKEELRKKTSFRCLVPEWQVTGVFQAVMWRPAVSQARNVLFPVHSFVCLWPCCARSHTGLDPVASVWPIAPDPTE